MFVRVKYWKPPKCSSKKDHPNTLWCPEPMKYYGALKSTKETLYVLMGEGDTDPLESEKNKGRRVCAKQCAIVSARQGRKE